jgi:hypothetical protein
LTLTLLLCDASGGTKLLPAPVGFLVTGLTCINEKPQVVAGTWGIPALILP